MSARTRRRRSRADPARKPDPLIPNVPERAPGGVIRDVRRAVGSPFGLRLDEPVDPAREGQVLEPDGDRLAVGQSEHPLPHDAIARWISSTGRPIAPILVMPLCEP